MKKFLASVGVAGTALLAGANAVAQQGGTAPGAEKALTPAEQKAADLRLPSLDRSSFTPESRMEEEVGEEEMSPFGDTVSGKPGITIKQPITEEKRIRNVLSSMRVSGLSGSPGSYRALVGPMMVVEGDMLPRLFAGQMEKLKVLDISERAVVLEFVDTGESKSSRTIGLPVALSPRVDSLLPGELFLKLVPLSSEGLPMVQPQKNESAEAVAQAIEQQQLQSLVDRPTELLNAPATEPKTDEQEQNIRE